jgi:hypothetical protein
MQGATLEQADLGLETVPNKLLTSACYTIHSRISPDLEALMGKLLFVVSFLIFGLAYFGPQYLGFATPDFFGMLSRGLDRTGISQNEAILALLFVFPAFFWLTTKRG